MRHYCTLFDRAYLEKGLAMYDSLRRHSSEDFLLCVLPMDEECRWILEEMALPNVHLINLEKFVTEMELGGIRNERTHQEWCWTCASQLCWYLMLGPIEAAPYLEAVTYLDSDLFFFSDPAPVFKEIGERSIAITPHRLIPSKRHLEVNGFFNVGFLSFRNTPTGRKCLEEWAAQCREWCYNRNEPMRFGDQKFLDAWPMRYKDEVCQLGIGVNVAPWNVGNYELFITDSEELAVRQMLKLWDQDATVICYHFHEFIEKPDGTFRFTNYDIRDEDIELIYRPYVEAYQEAKLRIAEAVMKLESERA